MTTHTQEHLEYHSQPKHLARENHKVVNQNQKNNQHIKEIYNLRTLEKTFDQLQIG